MKSKIWGVAAVIAAVGCGDDGRVESGFDSAPGAGETDDGPSASSDAETDGGADWSDGPDGSDGGADDAGGFGEPCDGFDNDEDGMVDEGCACDVGESQTCFAGPPEAALACRATTQTCDAGVGSEQVASWGTCGGLCDGATLSLADPTALWILGAAADDHFRLAAGGGLADLNGDGELDFVAASSFGDGIEADSGAGYALFGGPCLQGSTIDLAQLTLQGTPDADGIGGFVIDGATGQPNSPRATATDIDGDGLGDAMVLNTSSSASVVFGAPAMDAVYDLVEPDGIQTAAFTGGGGTGGNKGRGLDAVDFDADGFADIFMSAANFGLPTCPCGSQGVDVWWGRAALQGQTALDTTIPIGISTVGKGSQHNFSVVGGSGDFNNDGLADVTAGNGAANDSFVINYRSYVFFGNAERVLPSSMPNVTGADGFALSGGSGRGPFPNHQHGDFDGDGIDDLIAFANIPYSTAAEVHIVFGGGPFPPALTVADLAGSAGTTLYGAQDVFAGGHHMGVGDIDGDGYDDVALGSALPSGGVLIVWGRPGTAAVDVDTDPNVTVIAGAPDLGRNDAVMAGDVDGDGLADLLIGAPDADTQNGEDSGLGIVKFGSCLASQHNPALVVGQDGADTLTGSAQRDTMTGGRGDDVLVGGGGNDVMYGGQGDDRLVVGTLDFARVHGGTGLDTLVIDVDGALDLRTTGRARVQQIERFELGQGVQSLMMNAGDVSGLSDVSQLIEVDGDAADTVTLSGGWTAAGSADGYALYAHGALSVAVADDVTVILG